MEKNAARPSDNAKNGLRGLRAEKSDKLIAFLRSAYGIEEPIDLTDLGGSSCLNASFSANGRRYVARVYRPYVGPNRMRDINAVRGALRENGIPCPNIFPDTNGALFRQFEGRIVEVEEFVAHDGKMNALSSLLSALPLLGRMHSILEDVRVGAEGGYPPFSNYIAPDQVTQMTARGCRRLARWTSSAYHQGLIAPSLKLAALTSRSELPGDLQIVHGDFWDNNVLFAGGSPVGILDFDFMGVRSRIDDLALTLYFASMAFRSEYASGEWIAILRQMVELYDSGLKNRLTARERAALPAAIARQPLWSIGGWVALLDDEAAAYEHASDMLGPVEWALALISSVKTL